MKTRACFVTNSSSASVIISKDKISAKQLEHVYNHIEYAKAHFGGDYRFLDRYDEWYVREIGDFIHCWTDLDNFEMGEFLRLIGVTEFTEENF